MQHLYSIKTRVRFALSLFVALFCASLAQGQGWKPTGGPAANTILQLLKYNGYVFAAVPHSTNTDDGGVYRSADLGKTWTWLSTPTSGFRVSSSNRAPDARRLVVKGTNLFAATALGVFVSADNGTSWQNRSTGLNGAALDVQGIVVKPNGDLLIATWGSGVYISTDDGMTWFSTNNGLQGNDRVQCILSYGNTLWIGMTNAGGGLFKSTDGGQNWTPKLDSAGNQLNNLFNLYAGANGKMLAVTDFGGNFNGGAYLSIDSGKTWTQRNGHYQAGYHGLPFTTGIYSGAIDAQGAFILGSERGLYKSTDRGATWQHDTIPGLASPNITAILLEPAAGATMVGSAYAGGYGPSGQAQGGGVYYRPSASARWQSRSVGVGSQVGVGFLAVGNNRLFCGTAAAVGQVAGVFGSDNGLQWNGYSAGLSGNISALAFAQHGKDIFVGGYGSGVYRSSDTGKTWVPKNSNGNIFLTYSMIVRHDTIFQGTLGNFYRSTNNGDNWNTATIGLPTNPYVYGLVDVGGTLVAGVNGTIYTSRNGGNSWQEATNPGGRFSHFIALDANTALAGSDQGGVFRTTDRGATWTGVSVGTNPLSPAAGEFAQAANGIVLVACGNGVYFSKDKGLTWHAANLGFLRADAEDTHAGASAVAVLRDSVYASSGDGQGIWVRPLSEFVVTSTLAHASAASLQLYPNPAMGTITLTSSVSSGSPYKIVDMQGRTVQQGTLPESHTVSVADLIPGLYLLQTTTSAGQAVQRFSKN